MKADRYMFPHYKFYVREVKIKAYAQLLESYSSLTLKYMAEAFGVTEEYIDGELCRFIAGGRLHAKIDKVGDEMTTFYYFTMPLRYSLTDNYVCRWVGSW